MNMPETPAAQGAAVRRRGRGRLATVAALLLTTTSLTLGLASSPALAADPIAGAQTSGDSLFPNQGNGGYDVSHYDIAMTVNVAVSTTNNAVSASTIPAATTTVTAATTGAPLSSYSFDFQGSTGNLAASTLNVDSVTVDGEPATFSRIENTTTSNATTDSHKLIVTPANPVSGTFTTVVTYHGTPVRHTDTDGSAEGWNSTVDGATFVNQPVGAMTAFPNNDTPSDKATYTITVDAPSKLMTSNTAASANPGLRDAAVVSNGELVSKTPSSDGSRTTWVWNERKPMASELSLISVGRYDTYSSNITLASGRVLPEWTFIDPSISVANQNTTQATRAQLKSILDFYETKYGPYPGNSVGLVTDVVPSAINYALETQDRPFFPNSASRGTTSHEIMHQWWGDNVAPFDWNDIWLNEGPATYAETQVPFESSGTSTTSSEMSLYTSWNNTAASSSLWTVPTAAMTQASQLFGTQVYTRGSMALGALRAAIGPAAFETLMRQEQVQLGGTSRRTSEFIARAQAISGKDLSAFFNNWIYTSGKPAWPAKFNYSLTGPTAPVSPGDAVTYTLSSRNTGNVTQTGSVVVADLTDVLDDATLGTLPANVSMSGNTITWNVPSTAVGATSTVAIPATVNTGTTGDSLAATEATTATTLGSTCFNCTTGVVIGSQPISAAPAPTVAGSAVVGQTLTAATDGWPSGTAFTYQWTVDNTPIAGATGPTFVPDVYTPGLAVRVQVTGTNGALVPTTRTSDPTAAVTRAVQAGDTPTINGTPQVGSPLSVVPGSGWLPGTYFTYQWAANGTNISGATGPTYIPTAASQTSQVFSVTVTGTKAGYANLVKTSSTTPPNVPTAVTAQAGDQHVTVSFVPPATGPTPTGYTITETKGDQVGATFTAGGSTTAKDITGLQNGTDYAFSVVSTLNFGAMSAASTASNTVTPRVVAGEFVPLDPIRILDTRKAAGRTALTGGDPVEGGRANSLTIPVLGQGGVPASGVTAVVLNLAGVNASAGTYVTALSQPNSPVYTSNLNFTDRAPRSVQVTVPVAPDGTITLYNAFGTIDLIVDVEGYYQDGTGFLAGRVHPQAPQRLLDTRSGMGVDGGSPVRVGDGQFIDVQVTGNAGVPAGATAVLVNLVGVQPSQATYLRAYSPTGPQPYTSILNLGAGEIVANLATVPLSAAGKMRVFNASGTTDVVADVVGYVSAASDATGSRFQATGAQRVLDTRTGPRLGDGQSVDTEVNAPASATGVLIALASVYPNHNTYLSVTPAGSGPVYTASLNTPPGAIVNNAAVSALGSTATVTRGITITNAQGEDDAVVDVQGYFVP